MKGRVRAVAIGLGLQLGGCTTDLRVGVDTDAGSGASEGDATAATGGADGGPNGEGGQGSGPTGPGTSDPDPTTATEPSDATMALGSTGEGETSPEPETTTGEPATESGVETTVDPTGDPPAPCTAKTQDQCLEDPLCMWVGLEPGECTINPCEDPENDCLALAFEACVDAPGCAWVGRPKVGECGAIECVPCEVLDPEQCTAVEGCEYDELEMACLPI